MKVEMSVLLFLVLSTSIVNGLCPSNCSCNTYVSRSSVICDSGSLKDIPDLPRDTYFLFINNNQISEIPVNTFVDCEQLHQIVLNSNEISAIEPFTFMNLRNLQYLNLSGNNISHIEEHAFGNFMSLSTLYLTSNPLNCNCSIYPFWSWLIERTTIGTSAKCSNGTFVISLRPVELEKCNPNSCQCFNGGTCRTRNDGLVDCDCIGHWTGEFCQESQCTSYYCGFGDC
ncbi:unnamed protein product [Mytilus coruscus]|uniref:EGF-like domain-containing protein n=1 Tax=Mytilus coruscus TaxID=42192 RepID=A0A6J8EM88_MYTCO|nr:unnamed protein product [Mytilus coruscus]